MVSITVIHGTELDYLGASYYREKSGSGIDSTASLEDYFGPSYPSLN